MIAYDDLRLIGHASAVPRRIRFGTEWLQIGYVEAVATAPEPW